MAADSDLVALGAFTPILTDILYGVDDPGGTPVDGKLTFAVLMTLLEANFTSIQSSANVGTLGSGTTAVEYGDGFNHVTVLTMGGTLPAITGDTAQAVGLLLYTLPNGVCRVKAIHMDVAITQSQGFINNDTPKVGIGSLIAATAVSVLNGTTEFDDYVVEQEATNCTGTTTDKSEDTSPAGLKLIEDGGVKTIFFNAADGWAAAAGGDAAATLSGTVTIEWTFLGA